ncbi:MAG: hypothetical protein AB7G06_01340 [Bdellovibrionales bacterium]
MTAINRIPTPVRFFIGTATLQGVEVVVFTTCQAEADHMARGGNLCGKIFDVKDGYTYARRDKVVALRDSGCSMTRAGFTPEQVELQNKEYDRAIKTLGLA